MDEEHRSALRKNRTFLINNIEGIEDIVDMLIEKDVITSGMQQEILQAKKTKNAQVRELLDILPKRGPLAFKTFTNILVATKQRHVAKEIDPEISDEPGTTCVPPEDEASLNKDDEKSGASGGTASTKPAKFAQPMSYSSSSSASSKGGKLENYPQPVAVVTGGSSGGASKPTASVQPITRNQSTKGGSVKPTNLGRQASREVERTYQPSDEPDPVSIPEASLGWPSKLDIKIASKEFKVASFSSEEIKARLKDPNVYNLSGKRKCVIINNLNFTNEALEERKISDMDSFRLTTVLKGLGIPTKPHTNTSRKTLVETLEKEKDSLDDGVCIFVLVVLSYGGNGTIMCTDGQMISIQEIVDIFSSQNCPVLKGVPKLMLIQACGAKFKNIEDPNVSEHDSGDQSIEYIRQSMSQLQLGSPTPESADSALRMGGSGDVTDTKGAPDSNVMPAPPLPPALNMSENLDVLVAMATIPDEPSQEYRSLFIMGLSYILCKYAKTSDFVQILKKVNMLRLHGSGPLELCQFKHSFTKRLYLVPRA